MVTEECVRSVEKKIIRKNKTNSVYISNLN